MAAPVVFTLGDKDYISKLNQMSEQAGDVQQAKADAETARSQAQQAVADAQQAGAAEVIKAAAEVSKAAQHVANAQSIAETGLPAQSGKNRASLVSNGTAATWEQIEIVVGPFTTNQTVTRSAQKTVVLVDTRSASVAITLSGFVAGDQVEIVKLFDPGVLTISSTTSMQAPDGSSGTSHTLTAVSGTVALFRGVSVFTMTIR